MPKSTLENGASYNDAEGNPLVVVEGGAAVPETAVGGGYEDLTNDDLRTELGNRGLPTSGNKSDLAARLTDDDAAQANAPTE